MLVFFATLLILIRSVQSTKVLFFFFFFATCLQEIDPEKQDGSAGGEFEEPKTNHTEVKLFYFRNNATKEFCKKEKNKIEKQRANTC